MTKLALRHPCPQAQRGNALYVLDVPAIGLHPADVDRLMTQSDVSAILSPTGRATG